ncbi:hypothetical protein [Mycolicibacterium sp. PDY-3]|uniref:hypothetical protein n=1 Tax=Mycolicibacterium sp. PDY-3 TaxID=3376069 RepID=UPI00378EFB70
MTTYSKGLENSKTNIEGFMKDMRALFTGGVASNFSATSLQVVQRGAGANMSVDVSIGDAHLVRPTSDYSFYVWQDAATNVAITTAPATNSRIDAIVAWVDTSVTNVSLNNSPGSLKFSAIVGIVAGSPVAPIDSAIQTALGSTVAWTRLANVTVGTSVTSIVNANISDQRSAITSRTSAGANTVGTTAIADGAVTGSKLATTSIRLGYAQITANAGVVGGTVKQVPGLTSTVTVPAGGRSVKITAYSFAVSTDAAGTNSNALSIWDGTVGSGTQIGGGQNLVTGAGAASFIIAMAVVTPSAGSKTFNVGAFATGGNPTVSASTTQPAFILVELI